MIKASESIPAAKESLMSRFALSDAQAQAIVEMTLGKLSGLERKKVEDRIAKLEATISELRSILADENKVKEILKSELIEIRDRFGDKRRSEIVEATEEIDLEDLIEKHTCVITMSHTGYIKRQRADTYNAQNRGGKGIIGMTTKEDDYVERVIVAHSHSNVLFFTNKGRVYMKKAYRIPEASRTAKGTNLVNIIELMPEEKVTSIISVPAFVEGEYLTMVTRRGVTKRTLLSSFEYQRRGGKIAISLDEGDELIFVRHTKGDESLIIATHNGLAVRFDEANIRAMGRTARGVRGITLADGDYVVGVTLVDEEKYLLTITENGMGKRSLFSDFRQMKNRGGHGVTCHKLTDKSGQLCSVATVSENDDVMLITNEGTIIRIPVEGINVYSRTAAGVIVMRLDEGSSIINLARLDKEEDIEAAERQAELDGERVVDDEGEEKSATVDTEAEEKSEAEDDGPESAEVDE